MGKKNVCKCVDGLSRKGELTWKLEGSCLRIGGKGQMRDFTDIEPAPWAALADQVQQIIVEDGVENVGGRAFMCFDRLERVELGRSVKRIGWRAFDGCCCLTWLQADGPLRHWRRMPVEGAIRVGYRAFCGTYLEQEELVIEDGVVLEYTGAGGAVVIPEGIREIAPYAFAHTDLESVTFPRTLERVGTCAFYATGLQTVTLPPRVCQVDAFAFGGNPLLRQAFLGRAGARVHPNAFAGTRVAEGACEQLGRWRFARDLRTIGFWSVDNGKWSAGELHQALHRGAVLLMAEPRSDGRFTVSSCCYSHNRSYAVGYTLDPCLSEWGPGGECVVESGDSAVFRRRYEESGTWISINGEATDYWSREELLSQLRCWKSDVRYRGAKLFLSRDRGNFQGPVELELCEKWLNDHPEAWIG